MAKERPTLPMCNGCAWNCRKRCAVIREPAYFLQKGQNCFARANQYRAREIENEIRAYKEIMGVC